MVKQDVISASLFVASKLSGAKCITTSSISGKSTVNCYADVPNLTKHKEID